MTNQYSYAESFSGMATELPKKKIAESNISSAAKVYMLSRMQKDNGASEYRHGNDNGQKYMTSEDFVTYFRSRGKIGTDPEKVAKSTVSGAEIYRSRVAAPDTANEPTVRYGKETKRAAYAPSNVSENVKIYKPASKKLGSDNPTRPVGNKEADVKIYSPSNSAENITVRLPGSGKSGNDTAVFRKVNSEKIAKIKSTAKEWIPEDKIVDARPKKNSRPMSRMILAMAGVAVSLMLIVSGSVLISGANSEVKKLENELEELTAAENELRMELEMKNDVNVLLERADDLGMIRKEYVEASYLENSGSDSITVHEDDEDKKVGIAAILSAFGIFG